MRLNNFPLFVRQVNSGLNIGGNTGNAFALLKVNNVTGI